MILLKTLVNTDYLLFKTNNSVLFLQHYSNKIANH